jgi:hypothetical protein
MGILLGLAEQIEGPTPSQQAMVEDGLPPAAIVSPEERRAAWKGRKLTKVRDLRVPAKDEDAATKQLRKELAAAEESKKAARFARLNELKQERITAMSKTNASKADQVAALRTNRAAAKGPKAATKAATSKKATKARAKATAAPRPAAGAGKGVRPGSKAEIIAGLLTRKQGCTAADIREACEWTAVNVPRQAAQAGLTLRQEKIDGVTNYFGSVG